MNTVERARRESARPAVTLHLWMRLRCHPHVTHSNGQQHRGHSIRADFTEDPDKICKANAECFAGRQKEEVSLMSLKPFQLPGRRMKSSYFTTQRFSKATKKQLSEDLEAIVDWRLKPVSLPDVVRMQGPFNRASIFFVSFHETKC